MAPFHLHIAMPQTGPQGGGLEALRAACAAAGDAPVEFASDQLFTQDPAHIARLCPPQHTHITLTVHDQLDELMQAYQTALADAGETRTADAFAESFAFTDIAQSLARWAGVFGAERLKVRVGEAVAHLAPDLLEFRRMVNVGQRGRTKPLPRLDQALKQLGEAQDAPVKQAPVSPAVLDRLRARFDAANRQVSAQYLEQGQSLQIDPQIQGQTAPMSGADFLEILGRITSASPAAGDEVAGLVLDNIRQADTPLFARVKTLLSYI